MRRTAAKEQVLGAAAEAEKNAARADLEEARRTERNILHVVAVPCGCGADLSSAAARIETQRTLGPLCTECVQPAEWEYARSWGDKLKEHILTRDLLSNIAATTATEDDLRAAADACGPLLEHHRDALCPDCLVGAEQKTREALGTAVERVGRQLEGGQ